ncbi:MAG: hypothetical protein IPF90_01785 [Actinomycetales bacterium]|jgi:hypothetical protein|nr:hypothetical protein [Candidatus Phosphoribacter baldrii]
MKLATVVWVVLALFAVLIALLVLWALRRRTGRANLRVDEQQARADLTAAGWPAPPGSVTPPSPYAAPAPYAAPSPEVPAATMEPSGWSGAAATAAGAAGVAGSVFARPPVTEEPAVPEAVPGQEAQLPVTELHDDSEEVILDAGAVGEVVDPGEVPQGESGSAEAFDDLWGTSASGAPDQDDSAHEPAVEEPPALPVMVESDGEADLGSAAEPVGEAPAAPTAGESMDVWTPSEGPVRPSPADAAAAAARARIESEGGALEAEPEGEAVQAVEPEAEVVQAQEPEAEVVQAVEPEAEVVQAEEPEAEVVQAEEPEAEVVQAVEPEAEAVQAVEPEAEAVEAQPEPEALLEGDEAALAGSPETDAAEAAYDEAEAEAAELSGAAIPLVETSADTVVESAAEPADAAAVAASHEEAAATLEADEAALAGAPVVDDAEARFQAALDAMTADRDALAAGEPVEESSVGLGEALTAGAAIAGGGAAAYAATRRVDDEASDDEASDDEASDDEVSDDAPEPELAEPELGTGAGESSATRAAQSRRRWVSEYDEVVDGGYGWGSAAPVWDGAMPLGHPVKANRQWMKFQEPADGWYDQMQADVWFVDAETARRFGFSQD